MQKYYLFPYMNLEWQKNLSLKELCLGIFGADQTHT